MNKAEVFSRFLSLVRIHQKNETNIGFYSRELGMSVDDLSRLIEEISDTAFHEWMGNIKKENS
ncbi:MAG: hypothetical protein LBQ60_12930 [Bacteroidales bacterium]|jgi:hypothetical protein|nr:hypothetical protein [Bacteroidales bacterium]